MKGRATLFTGLTLFALFFGAGNLIYPVTLGMESGTSYLPAIAGFILTGVGIPIITVVAISRIRGGAIELASRVHPLFGVVFISVVYLTIGPLFAIPRATSVAYESGLAPWLTESSTLGLLLFTAIFLGLVFFISLNPSKLVDRIGQLLTPVLFISIVGLVIGSFFLLSGDPQQANEKYSAQPFFTGFIEGYLTMDAIAALAFGIITVTSLRDRGVSQKMLTFRTFQAGGVAALGLMSVYISIGWIGAKMATEGNYDNGSAILAGAANIMYGDIGTLLLGLIVGLACFTTCVGLVVACAQFFSNRFPSLSYKQVALAVTLISFAIANLGLNQIVAYSVPVLVFVYPIAIVLVILTFTGGIIHHSPYVYRGAIILASLVSLYDGLVAAGVPMSAVTPYIQSLPLYEINLSWLVPALIGGIAGGIIHLLVPASPRTVSK
ncbi:branched-chain amino acid transport system II carrier protein [Halobacillus shinanisalinarum]|uniref:Branched-chain amino acid transport system carrier protein n=1 Tax=Halobacillus shinanisalinarum TaxID=2932258 RepID=A0ABY4H5I1_9BACI|nr:branched-chain amino acid transport system II carrier protein [Halobacillus shinanisalinarum]UOQ95180.1 branched-chain amino acid transport system II carrier protein [Halobacillus shinanisalinarum]